MHRRLAQVISILALGFSFLAAPAAAATARYAHTATLLPDGRTMIIGGVTGTGANPAALVGAGQIEIYDERAGTSVSLDGSTLLPNAFVARASHTATLMPNGNILVAGGIDGAAYQTSVQIINPNVTPPTCTNATALTVARHSHTSTLLQDGRVLICGGMTATAGPTFAGDCYIYNTAGTIQATVNMLSNGNGGRGLHTATLLRDGRVFIAGGQRGGPNSVLPTTELFSCTGAGGACTSGSFIAGKTLNVGRSHHTATMMPDGRVLILGGYYGRDDFLSGHHAGIVETGELYDPIADAFTTAAPMMERKMQHTATLQPDGSVLAFGGIGNITTTYMFVGPAVHVAGTFESGTLNGCLSGACGNFTASNTMSTMTINDTNSSARIDLNFKLNDRLKDYPVTGVIQDGEILFSSPQASIPLGKVNFVYGGEETTATAFRGLKVDLSGAKVECTSAGCGVIAGSFPLKGVYGQYQFDRTDFSLPFVTGGNRRGCVKFPGSLDSTSTGVAIDNASGSCGTFFATDPSYVCGAFDIPFDKAYAGANLVSAQGTLLAGTWTQKRFNDTTFTANLTAGTANFSVAGVSNALPRALATVNSIPTAQAVGICFTGLTGAITVSTTTPMTGPASDATGASTSLTVTVKLDFVLDKVDLKDQDFKVDIATVVVRRMLFQDFECYHPRTNTWDFNCVVPRPAQSNSLERFGASATLLPNGDIRYHGGKSCDTYVPIVLGINTYAAAGHCNGEVVDATANIGVGTVLRGLWSSMASMSTPRGNFTSTILPSGNVLLTGGTDGQNVLSNVEIYDPVLNTMRPAPKLTRARDLHTATLLINGRVLVAGGFTTTGSTGTTGTTELFYPETETWTAGASMNVPRDNHTATVLPDGRVMVIGGYQNGTYLTSVEIYDPMTNTWTNAGNLATARAVHTATLMKNGFILVSGGVNAGGVLNSVEIVNPATGNGVATTALPRALHGHSATLLSGGDVLVAGGSDGSGEWPYAYRYNPPAATWTLTAPLSNGRLNHTMSLLPNGHVIIAGGAQANGNTIIGVETFHESTNLWTPISSFTVARAYHDFVVAPNGMMLAIGGYNGSSFEKTGERLYFTATPDVEALATTQRQSKVASFSPTTFDRGQTVSVYGDGFKGGTEASGDGAGAAQSEHSHPRLLLQAVDHSGGASTQGNGGFIIDLTTNVFLNPGFSWLGASATLSAVLPPAASPAALPYGWYQMRVVNNGVYSDGMMVQAGPNRPTGTLASVTGVTISSTIMNWSWDATPISGQSGFNVYSATTGAIIASIADATPGVKIFAQGGLQPNVTAQIVVAPYSLTGDGTLAFSGTYYTYASSPTALSMASVSVTSLELRWSTNGNAPGTVYEVQMSTDNFATSLLTPVPYLLNVTTDNVVVQSLSPNTQYWFRVHAYNFQGLASSVTSPPTATGFTNVVTTTTRQTISGLAGSPTGTTSISWSWTDANINAAGGDRYRVYNATSGIRLASVSSPLFLDVALGTNTQRVVAVSVFINGVGEGPLTPGVTVYTSAAVPLPASPPVLNLSTGGFTAAWTANGNPSYTSYQCVVTPVGGTLDAGATLGSTTTAPGGGGFFCSVSGMKPPNALYDIRVRAINQDGVATDALDPLAILIIGSTATFANQPTALSLVQTSPSAIAVSWNSNNNSSSTTYEVSYTTDGFAADVRYAASFAQSYQLNSIVIGGLLTSTTYSIRVRAQNLFGAKTPYSNVLTTATFNGGAPFGAVGAFIPANTNVTITGSLGNGRSINMFVPSDAFPVPVFVAISSHNTAATPPVNACGTLNVAVNITVTPPVQPLKPVTLTLGYTPAELGAVPTTEAALERWDPNAQRCVPLSTSFDTANQTFTAQLNHFSLFQLAQVAPQASPDFALIFPNPFYPTRGHGYVTFAQLPKNTKVGLYTLRGEFMWEGWTNGSGILIWTGVNQAGRPAASGVYLAVAEADGKKHVYKVAVVR